MINYTLPQTEQSELREAMINTRLRDWAFYRFGGLLGVPVHLIAHPRGLPPGWKESNIPQELQRQLAERTLDLNLRSQNVYAFSEKLNLVSTLPIH